MLLMASATVMGKRILGVGKKGAKVCISLVRDIAIRAYSLHFNEPSVSTDGFTINSKEGST